MRRTGLPFLFGAALLALGAPRVAGQAAPEATPEPVLKITRPKPAAPAATPAATPVPAARKKPAPPPPKPALRADDPDVKELLDSIEATMQQGDPSVLEGAFDVAAVYDAAMRGTSASPAVTRQFREQKWTSGVPAVAADLKQNGGTYRLLRVRAGVGGRPEAVFRRIGEQAGVNYFVYALARTPAGVRIVDGLTLNYGEWLTQSLRRRWSAVVAVDKGRVSAEWLAMGEFGAEAERITALQAQGQFAEALAALEAAPAALHTNRDVLIWRLALASRVGVENMQRALQAFEKQFPGEPVVDMYLLDVQIAASQHDAALATLDRLAAAVGGDPYLDVMASDLLYQKGDLPASKAKAAQAAVDEPTLVNPWYVLLVVSLKEADHAATVEALMALEVRFGKSIADLATLPEYAGFVRSAEYAGWLRGRAIRVGGDVQEPRRLADAKPVSPPQAKKAKVKGEVALEALITPQGEVLDAQVVRSIPLLDQAAIETVKKWRYAPTLLNGSAVPVILAVTVNFK